MIVQAVILAAGMGTRLARPHPKPLTLLDDGRTIMTQRVQNLRSVFGDVVFDPRMLTDLHRWILEDRSFIAVDTSSISDEEVKFTVTEKGFISELSKTVPGGLGEAIGINYVSGADQDGLISRLAEVDDQEYFEGGIELSIWRAGARYLPLDISTSYAVKVDLAEGPRPGEQRNAGPATSRRLAQGNAGRRKALGDGGENDRLAALVPRQRRSLLSGGNG
ncbi:hypothetical protein BN1051_01799 [Arthrobacter saudimassiliensis]|uniref:MobA-like NTP transferase domain-containing protein n=1 Tax=Arthrobacter saudimassiliensis TaxID=1461584 RepID=A0A078MUE6_9MICC|nr:hypothetical protein BN1051_01799 [Arthrobacter saudimassiliensis]